MAELEDWVEDIENQHEADLLQLQEPDEREGQKIEAFQAHMSQRTDQITNVTKSIGKIQDMFKSLNEIVSQ